MQRIHKRTGEKPTSRTRLRTTLASGVLVLLWLLATTAAHAAPTPKVKICHKPGAANQRIVTVGQDDLEQHFDHSDYPVSEEECDGIDNDCDGLVDNTVATTCTPCPDLCVDGLQRAMEHVFTQHRFTQDCGFEFGRQAGTVRFTARVSGVGEHEDAFNVASGACFVFLNNVIDTPAVSLTPAEQQACAPIAAQVVFDITRVECNISPP